MAHVSKAAVGRLAAGEAGEVEVEWLAQHALSCGPCRALIAGLVEDMAATREAGGAAQSPD